MATSLKNLSMYDAQNVPSAAGMTFGIVVSDYNSDITFALLKGCVEALLLHGAEKEDVLLQHVPGSFELPLGAQLLYESHEIDGVICIGCVITGETKHDDYINMAVSQAIMQLGLEYNTPFVFGVLTPRTHKQALERAGGKHGNKGVEAAITAIKMVHAVRMLDIE